MKGNYITYHVLKACLSHKQIPGKDIYSELAETIAERKKILPRFEEALLSRTQKTKKDIHGQLAETLAERKRILQRLSHVLSAKKEGPADPFQSKGGMSLRSTNKCLIKIPVMILNALTSSNKKMKDSNHYPALEQVRIGESEQNRGFEDPFLWCDRNFKK